MEKEKKGPVISRFPCLVVNLRAGRRPTARGIAQGKKKKKKKKDAACVAGSASGSTQKKKGREEKKS